uniref:F-box domain-containing protein n=1 Tax=Setaria italica TaxID=4555 RepID=K3ZLR1_SETIT
MAANRQQPSLETLPTKLLTVIAIHLATTSDQIMEDLGKLRVTCTVMRRVCGQRAIGRRVALLRCWEEMQWNQPGRYYSLIRLLLDVGNPEASLLTGILDFFRGYQPSLDQLSCVAAGGLNVAVYLYALMLYRNAGGSATADMAKMYIRRLEGEEGTAASGSISPKILHNFICRECREDVVYLVVRILWNNVALPPAPGRGEFPCDGGGCGFPNGCGEDTLFCSEDYRLRHELAAFERRIVD